MKENIRNTKSRDELGEIEEKMVEMHRFKNFFFFCAYKMVEITKKHEKKMV